VPRIPFDELPPDARLWIFAASRPLTEDERGRILAETDAFIDHWTAHGVPLSAARELRHGQFVLVGVNERAAGASGCSIDALVRRMGQLQSTLGVELTDNAPVLFRSGEAIERVPRERFAELAEQGEVGPDTIVFDNTVERVADVRSGRWETRAADAWHARAFFNNS
jgi:hypothetical protein